MRFLFALLMVAAPTFAQDAGIAELAGKLAQQLASRQIRSVAVLRFTNSQNYDSQLNAYLIDRMNRALVTQVTQGQPIDVVGRPQSDGLLRELRLVDTADLATKDVQTIASRLMVGAIITGAFNVVGQEVYIETTIMDGATSHLIGGDSAKLQRADLNQYLVERKGPPPGPALSIPSGSMIEVKLNEKVDAASARNGRTVSASLESNVVVGTVTVARKGAEVKLMATSPDGMELHIALASVSLADQSTATASSDPIIKPATSSRAKGALGSVLGGISNGGSLSVPQNAPAQMKPGEVAKDSTLSLRLNQDAR